MTAEASARHALRSVARRWRSLDEEARTLRTNIRAILNDIAPDLLAVHGVGDHTAGQLLVTAGDNPDRLHHENSFAALCGSTPVAASSGKTRRHRAFGALARFEFCGRRSSVSGGVQPAREGGSTGRIGRRRRCAASSERRDAPPSSARCTGADRCLDTSYPAAAARRPQAP